MSESSDTRESAPDRAEGSPTPGAERAGSEDAVGWIGAARRIRTG